MFRSIINKDQHPTLYAPIPQRRRIVDGSAFATRGTTHPQQQYDSDNMHFLNMSVLVPTTTKATTTAADFDPPHAMIPSNIFTSISQVGNNNSSTAFVVHNKSPRPDTPKSSSYPSACSPLTVCSVTWRHSPSPLPDGTAHGFVPIPSDKVVVPAPSPLSQVLKKQRPWETGGESAYHPYASPVSRGRALPSPSLTLDTCSVTTFGTETVAGPTPTSQRLLLTPPCPPLKFAQQHTCRPASSLAVAAGWFIPADPSTATVLTTCSNSSHINAARSKSAPTLPTTTSTCTEERKIRLKTELCMHYESGRRCPFGSSEYISVDHDTLLSSCVSENARRY